MYSTFIYFSILFGLIISSMGISSYSSCEYVNFTEYQNVINQKFHRIPIENVLYEEELIKRKQYPYEPSVMQKLFRTIRRIIHKQLNHSYPSFGSDHWPYPVNALQKIEEINILTEYKIENFGTMVTDDFMTNLKIYLDAFIEETPASNISRITNQNSPHLRIHFQSNKLKNFPIEIKLKVNMEQTNRVFDNYRRCFHPHEEALWYITKSYCFQRCDLLTHGQYTSRLEFNMCVIDKNWGCNEGWYRPLDSKWCWKMCKRGLKRGAYEGMGPFCLESCRVSYGKGWVSYQVYCIETKTGKIRPRIQYWRGPPDLPYRPKIKGTWCNGFAVGVDGKCPQEAVQGEYCFLPTLSSNHTLKHCRIRKQPLSIKGFAYLKNPLYFESVVELPISHCGKNKKQNCILNTINHFLRAHSSTYNNNNNNNNNNNSSHYELGKIVHAKVLDMKVMFDLEIDEIRTTHISNDYGKSFIQLPFSTFNLHPGKDSFLGHWKNQDKRFLLTLTSKINRRLRMIKSLFIDQNISDQAFHSTLDETALNAYQKALDHNLKPFFNRYACSFEQDRNKTQSLLFHPSNATQQLKELLNQIP